jgi:heparanase 1
VVGSNFWSPDGITERIPPYDFTRQKLRNLTAELAPAYLRIGGSEADIIYYDMTETPVSEAPDPYLFVLDRTLWDEVCNFAVDLELEILFTLNAGPGPRDQNLQWTPDNARHFIEYTRSINCPVVIWELGNEINGFQAIHGTGFRIEGDQYAVDMGAARRLVDEADPGSLLAGPSSAFWPLWGEMMPVMPDFMAAGGQHLDVVTWHYYPQQSVRCPVASRPAEPDTFGNA